MSIASPPGGAAMLRNRLKICQSGSWCNSAKRRPVQLPRSTSLRPGSVWTSRCCRAAMARAVSCARSSGLATIVASVRHASAWPSAMDCARACSFSPQPMCAPPECVDPADRSRHGGSAGSASPPLPRAGATGDEGLRHRPRVATDGSVSAPPMARSSASLARRTASITTPAEFGLFQTSSLSSQDSGTPPNVVPSIRM